MLNYNIIISHNDLRALLKDYFDAGYKMCEAVCKPLPQKTVGADHVGKTGSAAPGSGAAFLNNQRQ